MPTVHPRTAWTEPKYPVVGPAMYWPTVTHSVLHYTAAVNLPDGDLGEFEYHIPPYLRAIQRDYTLNRGYSIGYNWAVDWLGGIWTLRGHDIKCAANQGWNDRTSAILCLVDGNDATTSAADASIRWLIGQINDRAGRQTKVVDHATIGATACAGTGIRAKLKAGLYLPEYRPEPPPAPPADTIAAIWAATGGDMLEFVGSKDHPGPTRWVSNGQVRTTPTYEYALHLTARGLVSNTLASAVMLTDAELAGLPLVE